MVRESSYGTLKPMKLPSCDSVFWYVVKQTILGTLVIVMAFLLFACSPITLYGKGANDIRAAIDECHQNKLAVLLFERPDHQVYAIRCTPPASEVDKVIMVRPKTPINVLRPFFESMDNKETIVIQQPKIQ